MKPLQHAQISQKTHGGCWQDYIDVHNFLDSSKSTCAHFKHRFLLHHSEGIELGVKICGQKLTSRDNKTIETRQLLTEHLIEDLGKVVKIEDWAQALLPDGEAKFNQFLTRKREQIENNSVTGEKQLFDAFRLSENDRVSVCDFLRFPLKNSTHPAALLVSHNSFAIFLAEKIFGVAFAKDGNSNKQLISVREVFERLIFLRFNAVYSPAEIIVRTNESVWMRGK